MVYLDNAATTGKKPGKVVAAVRNALINYSANPGRSGHRLSEKTALAVYNVREKTAKLFGASGPEKVIFTSGCTQSINMVLKGVLEKGDHIIVSCLEHNSVMRPLYKMGIDFSVADVSFTDDDQTLENFKNLILPNTKMIFVMGASNVFGKKLPIKKLGELCRQKGILFGVDAAQTAGVVPINMKNDGIDFLCIAAHKGLYAPMGIGVLIAENAIKNTIIEGGTGTDSINKSQPESLPERFESGTVNVPGIMGLGAGIDFVNGVGIDNIAKHEMKLINKLYHHLSKNENIMLYTAKPDLNSFAPVLSFNIKDMESSVAAGIIERSGIAVRAGLHCAPAAHKFMGTIDTGTVRVCPSVFTTNEDIYRLVNAVKKIEKK